MRILDDEKGRVIQLLKYVKHCTVKFEKKA